MNNDPASPDQGLPLTSKAVAVLAFLLLAVNLLLGWLLAGQSRDAMKRQLDQRMLDCAVTAARQLDGDAVARLQAGDEADPAYQTAMATLRSFQNISLLRFIYGIRELGDGSFILTFDPSPADAGAFGDPIQATPALREAAQGRAAVCAEPYTDTWGRFYSAFSPVFTSQGKVAGIVGVDVDAAAVEAEVSRQSWAIAASCLASLLGSAGVLVYLMLRQRRRFQTLAASVNRLAGGIDALVEGMALPEADKMMASLAGGRQASLQGASASSAEASGASSAPAGAGSVQGASPAGLAGAAGPARKSAAADGDIGALAGSVNAMLKRVQERLASSRNQALSMISALSADYRDVFFVDLAADIGVCYRSDASRNGKLEGEVFPFRKTFEADVAMHIHKDYRAGLLRLFDSAWLQKEAAGSPVVSYRYLTLRSGRESWELMRIAPIGPSQFSMSISDVDDETRRALEQSQALREALAVAEEASRAKTSFLSSMSHEIRTPMNAIIGLDSIALSDPDISPATRSHLERIGASARHLLGLINDILDMSRIESGRLALASTEFSFPALLEQVNVIIGGQCQEKGLEYRCTVKGRLRDYYVGDAMKLKQVLINILGNAVKFTPAGGWVGLEIEQTAGYRDQASLRFVISDTGKGMDRDFLPRLFKPFSQEDSSSTSRYGSTGLGLAITKSIVELMHGRIEVESEKGKGTVFTVTVTLAESSRSLAGGDFEPGDLKVLVVDGGPDAGLDGGMHGGEEGAERARIVLEDAGIHAESARSGPEALAKLRLAQARQEPCSLFIVDGDSPNLDGFALAQELRAEAGRNAVILLAVGSRGAGGKTAGDGAADGFLAKPIFAGAVIDAFRKVLAGRQSAVPQGAPLPDALQGRRVLLAEDNAINAEIIQTLLKMRGMEVDTAANGRICLERFRASPEGHYDAILMDMRMPEMDGLATTEALRGLKRADAGRIPVIALTANAFNEDVVHSLQSGLNAHLSKPVEPELLYRTLEGFLAGKAPAA